ncbi:MAG: FtsX-like permease family protein [Gracilibacteraceae bacterium]|nr:FtsX-like permease family protein [Gracilibacteraceae bacterium]
MKKLDLRLMRMLRRSKGQFISVAVIVAVALCIYILFSTTSTNLENSVEQYYEMTNISYLTIELVRIPQGVTEDLVSIEGIRNVQGRISVDVPLEVEDDNEKVNIRLISLPDDGGDINKLFTEQKAGMGPNDNDSVILLEQFAKARNIKTGDIITPRINGRIYRLKVSGIASSSEFVYLMENEQTIMPAPEKFGVAYISEDFAQSVFGYKGSFNEMLVKTKTNVDIDDVIDSLEQKLDKYGIKKIIKLEDQLSNDILKQELDGIEMMSNIIPVMFLVVAAIIISIMLSRIVNNDRMAIGVLKALGYGNNKVLFHYIKYSLAIGLTGAVIGISVGILLAGPISRYYTVFFNIPLAGLKIEYSYIFYGMLLTCIFCTASGLLGARRVIRILPADSMRPEAPKSGKRTFIEQVTIFWKHVPFSWKMVIRNILRNKKRFAFLVLGLAMAFGINTVPLYMKDAMMSMFELQYGEYQKMDYTIQFTKPQNKNVIIDLNNLIDADKIEPRIEYPFELAKGWRNMTVNVIGVPRQTAFHKFVDMRGNVIILPNRGVFITEAIAEELNVGKGDTITIKNFIPGKKDIEIKVAGIFRQYLGANAYINIEAMEELLLEKQLITGVSIETQADLKEELKDAANISAVNSVDDMYRAFSEYMDLMLLAIGFYMLFGGILGFALIYNSTIIAISERAMEFATLRIMGFDKKDVYGMISRENFVMAGIAIIVGIPLGAGMIKGMVESFSSDIMTLPFLLSPDTFIQAAVATIFFVVIAQLATLKKIYNLDFIDALKSRIS